MTDTERRAGYIAGLRQLANILEANDKLPLPWHGNGSPLLLIAGLYDDHRAIARAFTRAMPGTIRKEVRGESFDLTGKLAGLSVTLIVDRNQVCERVVTGVETVTIPAQPATQAQPERTEQREIVEWRCAPLLADNQAGAS